VLNCQYILKKLFRVAHGNFEEQIKVVGVSFLLLLLLLLITVLLLLLLLMRVIVIQLMCSIVILWAR
jgi:hypothetical protein